MKIKPVFAGHFANPGRFLRLAAALTPWLGILCLLLFGAGLYDALVLSPPDYQQHELVRIMYVHVPAAWVSLALYAAMALMAGIGLVLRHTLADIFCQAAAPVGAMLTALCLVTGSIWGQPTWGTWWVWDARLTSVLILFLLYLGYVALRGAFTDDARGSKAGAILLLMGAVNLPIVKFSVDWWHTLHQPASVLKLSGSTIHPTMLRPLLLMALAYMCYTGWMVMIRMQSALQEKKLDSISSRG